MSFLWNKSGVVQIDLKTVWSQSERIANSDEHGPSQRHSPLAWPPCPQTASTSINPLLSSTTAFLLGFPRTMMVFWYVWTTESVLNYGSGEHLARSTLHLQDSVWTTRTRGKERKECSLKHRTTRNGI